MTSFNKPERFELKGASQNDKFYVYSRDHMMYLHQDLTLQSFTLSDTGIYGGYFKSKKEAYVAMAKFWLKEQDDKTPREEELVEDQLTAEELNLIFKDAGLTRMYYLIQGKLIELGCDDIERNSKYQLFGFLCNSAKRSNIDNILFHEYSELIDFLRELKYEDNEDKYKDEQELIDVLKTI